jgi:epoxide hydrolase-like predicted phosphatase
MWIQAVIFDLGGVISDSPMDVFARFEAGLGLAPNTLNHHIVRMGRTGAWSRLERGELNLSEFCDAFDAELAEAGIDLSTADLMAEVAENTGIRPAMIEAVRHLRNQGFKVAALTNNWVVDDGGSTRSALKMEFDVFVESSKAGLQKPDPRIYELVCRELDIKPEEAVFLDDIGRNLKTARQLGMTTIKVTEPEAALAALEKILGISLPS